MNELQKGLLKDLILNIFNESAKIMEHMVINQHVQPPFDISEAQKLLSGKFSVYALLKDNPQSEEVLLALADKMAKDDKRDNTDLMAFLSDMLDEIVEADLKNAEDCSEQMLELFSAYINIRKSGLNYN